MRRAMVALLVSAGQAYAVEMPCPVAGAEPVVIAAVDPRLELRLADGRRLRLIGLDPAAQTPNEPDLDEVGRAILTTAIGARPVTARLLSDRPDRWGRLPAAVFVEGEAFDGGLSAMALARGLGRFLPETAAHDCRPSLLAAEAQARTAGLGLWHDPYYGVLAVDDAAAFVERSATAVVAQGRLRRVESGPFRTKLRFSGPDGPRQGMLVAVVLPKVVKRFEERGVHFEALIGRTLRLRGLLDLHFGPQIELATPDALEILPDDAARDDSARPETTRTATP